jgi:imidazolonepropionase-like amidohydrolase
VQVSSSSELDACLATFNQFGLKPILVGNPGVSSRHASRIAGVLMTSVTSSVPSGVPVMFRSDAEQAAADLLDQVAMAVADGLSPSVAVRALTGDAATMLKVHSRVGFLRAGQDADVVLFDGPPLHPSSRVVGVLVDGEEITD